MTSDQSLQHSVLGTMVLPVAKFTVKRRKEADLRLSLRLMRNAIDEYKRLSDQGLIYRFTFED